MSLEKVQKKKIWVPWKYFSLLKEKSSLSSGAKKVWKETGQGGLGRGKSANKDKDLNPISPMVTSTVYPARWSQKIIKEFRTRKKYNKSHHFTAGVYFFLPNQSKREDWWCALEENCTIWNGPRRYKFASNCVLSRHDGSSKMFWKASVSEIGEVIFVNLCCTYVFLERVV